MKTTSTPWEVHEDYPGHSLVILGDCDDQGCVRIAEIVSEEDGDAHLIVRAVNAHEELLKACEEAKKFVIEMGSAESPNWDSVRKTLNSAIAKAEGR